MKGNSEFDDMMKKLVGDMVPLALASTMMKMSDLEEKLTNVAGALQSVIKFIGEDKLAAFCEKERAKHAKEHAKCSQPDMKSVEKALNSFDSILRKMMSNDESKGAHKN